MLQIVQTANARKRQGIEIHKFRLAMLLPVCCQKFWSSGRQSSRTKTDGVDNSGRSETYCPRLHSMRSARRIVKCIHNIEMPAITNSKIKLICHTPKTSLMSPKVNGNRN